MTIFYIKKKIRAGGGNFRAGGGSFSSVSHSLKKGQGAGQKKGTFDA